MSFDLQPSLNTKLSSPPLHSLLPPLANANTLPAAMARLHTLTAAALLLLLALAGGASAARQLKECVGSIDLTGTGSDVSSSVSTQTVYEVQQGVGSAAAACRGGPNAPGCKQMVEAVAQVGTGARCKAGVRAG